MELTIQHVLLIGLSFASVVTGQNPCISLPCKNGGSCSPGEISYQCFCINGYTGQNCTELTFEASIGIYDANRYLPVIRGEVGDMTEYNAQRLRRWIHFTFALRSRDIRSTFNWTRNGTVLELASWRFRVDNILGTLTISFSSLDDEGVYQVFVSNEFGTLLGRKIPLKFAVTGGFLSPNTPINLTMIEGEPFLLPCPPRAYSYPRVEYEWITGTGQPIPESFRPRILTEPNGDLLFSSVEASDFFTFMNPLAAPLRCRARGLFFDTVLGPPVYFYVNSTSVTPSPNSSVRFYTKPQGVYTVLAGDQFYLNCTAGGRPLPEIRWYQNGAPINNSGDFFLHQNFNRTLRLGSLNPGIHDGFYACEAVSNNRSITATFQVKVLGKVNALYEITGQELEFRAGKYGGSVKMFCNTTGHPIINRTWYYNGVELKYSARFLNRWSVDSNGTLEIRHLRLNDFGFFQCFAENLLSQGDRRTYLVVTGAPLPPINVQVTNCANHTTNITWELRLPSDILPTGFIIESRSRPVGPSLKQLQWPSFSKVVEIPVGFSRSHEVNDLKPWNEIQFRVRAKNSLGYGFPGSIVDGCVTSSKAPFYFPKDLRSTTLFSGDSIIRLNWTPLDELDWSGPNCVYRLFYRQNTPSSPWKNVTITNCGRSAHTFFGLLPNTEYEVAIRAENSVGAGRSSPTIRVRSGQRQPSPLENVTIVRVNSSSVELEWSAIQVLFPRTVDGYVVGILSLQNWILAAAGNVFPDIDEPGLEAVLPGGTLKRRKRSAGIPEIERTLSNNTIAVLVNASLRGVVTGLKPWTTYEVAVAGYNNAGLGNPKILTVTTLDSKDSYFLLSMRIVSEDFTEDLKDRSSSKFINLERNLTTELSSLYQKEIWFKKASLLALRPGSVIADVQLEAASPNASVVLDVVSGMNNLGNFSLDRNETKMKIEQGIQNVIVSASSSRVNVSDRIVLFCFVIGGPNDLNITWYKAGKVIGLTHRTKVETILRHSNLAIRDVRPEDEGNYTCNAGKGIQNRASNIFIEVIPVLSIKPQAVSKRVGDEATFTCTAGSGFRTGSTLLLVEVTDRDNIVRHQSSSFTASNLQIPQGVDRLTRRFVCELWAQQTLLSTSEEAELIIVARDAPTCPAQIIQGIAWAATAAAGIDIQPCPNGASGSTSRECSNDAKWKDPSFLGCSSFGYILLQDQIEAATDGFQSNTSAGEVLAQLANVTNPITKIVKRPREIYGGDLLIAVDILVLLAGYNNASQGNISSKEHVKDLAQVVSNLLEPENAVTWLGLEQEGQGRGRSLVNAVDDYGLGVAATLTESTKSRTVATKNLKLTIKRITPESVVNKKGLRVSHEQSSIRLPSEAFHSGVSRFVSAIYLTLNDVFPLAKTKSEDMTTLPNTTVVSATVLPAPPEKFNKPVKIVLQNRGVSDPSGASPKATCVFWRKGAAAIWKTSGCELVPSESDAKMTTCKCDHLTIFASLMDPFDSTIGEADTKALEMMSIIGCTISLIAVLVTIVVTLLFWRAVKSPRSKVLLNLCVAVALSCIFVIFEGSARGNKVGCTVVAAFLHYFLLSLFSWMLCEGVLLYILLVKVFGGSAEEKVKYFYIFGWGFPAIIVAISLAATQAVGYGNAHACWLDVSSGLIWAFIAPAITIILVNIVVFVLVIRQMMGTRHVQNKTQIEKVKAGVKASAVILPLLGITWLFGLLSFNSATIAFKYIFVIANSLQGLMIFIFHCLLNKQINDAIKRMREKSSSAAVSSNPKSKASPKSQAKFAGKQLENVPKKLSNRVQNDYDMMQNVGTLTTNSSGNQDSIIEIPKAEKLPDRTKKLQNTPGNVYDDLLPKDDKRVLVKEGTGCDVSINGILDGNTSVHSLQRREAETGEFADGRYPEQPNSADELYSIDGSVNRLYKPTPGKGEPFFEEKDMSAEPTLHGRDSVNNDEDFEIKMKGRRQKVDNVQNAAEAFVAPIKKERPASATNQSARDKIRQMIYQGTFKVPAPGYEAPDKQHKEGESHFSNQKLV
ncbi:uncharacterized protein [Montipora foliosa]